MIYGIFIVCFRSCKTFGRQSWVIVAIIITEFLVIAKFDFGTITKPLPTHIAYFWILGCSSLILWTLWKFVVNNPKFNSPIKLVMNGKKHQSPSKEENKYLINIFNEKSSNNLHHRLCDKHID